MFSFGILLNLDQQLDKYQLIKPLKYATPIIVWREQWRKFVGVKMHAEI